MTLFASAIVIVAVLLAIALARGFNKTAAEMRRFEDWEGRDHG